MKNQLLLNLLPLWIELSILASALGGLFCMVSLLTGWRLSQPRWRGRDAWNFDGIRFQNPLPRPRVPDGLYVLYRLWQGCRSAWPRRVEARPGPPPPDRVGPGELRVTFVGHASTLVQVDGLNLLTDPVWSENASPFTFLGPKRVRAPGVRFEDLPPIDAVLISHDHYDHMDLPTLRRLQRDHRPRFLVGQGNRAQLEGQGLTRVAELDWFDSTPLSPGVDAHFVPAQHFSGRGLFDRDGTLWGGFVVTAPGGPVYFAGDTAFGPHFEDLRRRFGPVRLALLPIGSYLPRWFMAPVHVSPDESVSAHRILEAEHSLAIHHGTFPMGEDGLEEPERDLDLACEAQGVDRNRFRVLECGEPWEVPPCRNPRFEAEASSPSPT